MISGSQYLSKRHNIPRSYIVKTNPGSELRHNRHNLLHTNEHFVYAPYQDDDVTDQSVIPSSSSSGNTVTFELTGAAPASLTQMAEPSHASQSAQQQTTS